MDALVAPEVFRLLVERAQTGVLVLQDHRIVFANQQVAHLTGYSVQALTDGSVSVAQLIAPSDRARVFEQIRQRIAGVPGQPYELRCV
ncbi:MAG: PAS domain-containing protein, partial [Pseudomonadota bacterium]